MSAARSTMPVDGALGTTLQLRGLPRGQAADSWVEDHPDDIRDVHRAFVDAGARVLRTATLCSRPDGSAHPEETVDRLRLAVALARSAGPDEVWLSLGPRGPSRGAIDGLEDCLDAGADRVLLETFVDPAELLDATAHLAEHGATVVASLVPGAGGLLADAPYPTHALRDAGACTLGINCGRDPQHALHLWRTVHDEGDWFVAPAWGEGFADVWRALHGRVAWLGGCCGVDPSRWEAAWPH